MTIDPNHNRTKIIFISLAVAFLIAGFISLVMFN